jgi:hypothetical protein
VRTFFVGVVKKKLKLNLVSGDVVLLPNSHAPRLANLPDPPENAKH